MKNQKKKSKKVKKNTKPFVHPGGVDFFLNSRIDIIIADLSPFFSCSSSQISFERGRSFLFVSRLIFGEKSCRDESDLSSSLPKKDKMVFCGFFDEEEEKVPGEGEEDGEEDVDDVFFFKDKDLIRLPP